MITAVTALFFLGFWALSVGSKRAVSYPPQFLNFLIRKKMLLNSIGWVFVSVAYAALIILQGFGKGIIYGSILLMAIASLIIVLQPLKVITYKGVFLILTGLLVLELTL